MPPLYLPSPCHLTLPCLLAGEGSQFTHAFSCGCAMALVGFGLYSHATLDAARRKAATTLPLAAAHSAGVAAAAQENAPANWRVPAVHGKGAAKAAALGAGEAGKENGGQHSSAGGGGKPPLLNVLQAHSSGRTASW